jgi:hypothetical protein
MLNRIWRDTLIFRRNKENAQGVDEFANDVSRQIFGCLGTRSF